MLDVNPAPSGALRATGERVGNYRWAICALLFFITTINYIDRQIIGVLEPTIARDIHLSQIDYGVGGMFVAQAAGQVLQHTGSYVPLFTAAAGAYLLAVFHPPDLATAPPRHHRQGDSSAVTGGGR
jgi:hypothetical protein